MTYKLCASEDCQELLHDHLLNTGKCCQQVIKNLIIYINQDIGYITGVLHDIGKALNIYQKKLNYIKTFVGHEIISALIAKYLIDNLDIDIKAKFSIIYAVLMHHQASGSVYDRFDSLLAIYKELISKDKDFRLLKFDGEVTDVLCDVLGTIFNREAVSKAIDLCEKNLKRMFKEYNIMKYIMPKEISLSTISLRARHISRSLCGILMICDKFIASRARARKGRVDTYYSSAERLIKSLGYNIDY